MEWQERCRDKLVTAEAAANVVKSGDRVVFSVPPKPTGVTMALAKQADRLKDVTLVCTWFGDFPWLHPGLEESFNVEEPFTTRYSREATWAKQIDYIMWLPGLGDGVRSTMPMRGSIHHHADVYVCKVDPPDEDGYCSFGHEVWYSPTAARTARITIAEVYESYPRTYPERIHISELDYLVAAPKDAEVSSIPFFSLPETDIWEKAQVIGSLTADLINDGDTIEIGGGVPSEAVMDFLGGKNDLGLDTELVYPQIMDLVQKGVITGKRKNINTNRVTCTAMNIWADDPRNKPVLNFINKNTSFNFHEYSYIVNIPRIASNENMVAINTILSIDLNGQAILDHIGRLPIGGPGGQVEYSAGTHYAKGGKSITCLLTTAKDGKISRVVPEFEAGSVVGMPSYFIDYLITEYGVVNLEYKSRRQKAEAIISVAHPDFRPELQKYAQKMFYP